jgi:hypothetical protein
MPFIAKDRWPLVLWLISVVLGLATVAAVLRQVGMRHLERSAEVTAEHHAHVLAATVPGLPDLLQRGRLDEPTVQQLRNLRRAGQVFRFKLFAQDGRQLLVSDDLDKPAAGLAPNGAILGDEHGERSSKVSAIVLSGGSFIELKDGIDGLVQLIFVKNAVLPQQGKLGHCANETKMLERAIEEIFLRQYRNRCRTPCNVVRCDSHRVEIIANNSL